MAPRSSAARMDDLVTLPPEADVDRNGPKKSIEERENERPLKEEDEEEDPEEAERKLEQDFNEGAREEDYSAIDPQNILPEHTKRPKPAHFPSDQTQEIGEEYRPEYSPVA